MLLCVKRWAAVWWQVDQGVAYAHDIEGLALAVESSIRCPFVASVLLPVVMPIWGTMLKAIAEPVLKPFLMAMLGTISVSITGSVLNPIVSFVRWFSLNPQQARNACFEASSSDSLLRVGLQRHSRLVQLFGGRDATDDASPQSHDQMRVRKREVVADGRAAIHTTRLRPSRAWVATVSPQWRGEWRYQNLAPDGPTIVAPAFSHYRHHLFPLRLPAARPGPGPTR